MPFQKFGVSENEEVNTATYICHTKFGIVTVMYMYLLYTLQIYKGYVDDPRNTDNAWMETQAMNFHDEDGSSVGAFDLHAGTMNPNTMGLWGFQPGPTQLGLYILRKRLEA